LASLRVAPADLADPTKWRGPYAKKDIPPDPWQNAYIYELIGPNQYKVYSAGPDGQPGTDDDIGTVSG
jgi:general secretion pathway protein G